MGGDGEGEVREVGGEGEGVPDGGTEAEEVEGFGEWEWERVGLGLEEVFRSRKGGSCGACQQRHSTDSSEQPRHAPVTQVSPPQPQLPVPSPP